MLVGGDTVVSGLDASGLAPADGLSIAPFTLEVTVEEPGKVNFGAVAIAGALGIGGGPRKPRVGEIDTSGVLCFTI